MGQDIITYISKYIPPFITINGEELYFQMFINHAFYDFRMCYESNNGETFKYLYENICNDSDLLESLKELRKDLKNDKVLPKEYNNKFGRNKPKWLSK